jgi:hypothetical protein
VANLLVPDLIAYHGPSTTYSGPTVAALQNFELVNTGTSDGGGPIDVFSVFDSLTITSGGLGDDLGQAQSTGLSTPGDELLAAKGIGRPAETTTLVAGIGFGPATLSNPTALIRLPSATVAVTSYASSPRSQQPGWPKALPSVGAPIASEYSVALRPAEFDNVTIPVRDRLSASQMSDLALAGLVSEGPVMSDWKVLARSSVQVVPGDGTSAGANLAVDEVSPGTHVQPASAIARRYPGPEARLLDILLAAGFCSFGAGTLAARSRQVRSLQTTNPTHV